jgi:hypothetical protein
MMLDRGRFSTIQFPSEWGIPRFQLGQLVRSNGNLAVVIGVNYVSPMSDQCLTQDVESGWWAEFYFITHSTRVMIGQTTLVSPSALQNTEPESNPNRTEFDRIIHTEPLRSAS